MGGGGGGRNTPLPLGFNIRSFKKKILYCSAFTFSTFGKLSLNMWFLALVMIRGLVGITHDKVEGHSIFPPESMGEI